MDVPRQPGRGPRSRKMRVFLGVAVGSFVLIAGLLVTLIAADPSGSAARFQAASDPRSTCSPWGTISIQNNAYIYQQDEWNSTHLQCATVSGVGFKLTRATFDLPNGLPATYPSIYVGCQWGRCSDPAASHLPIQESHLAKATTSVDTQEVTGGENFDVAYDIWFNQTPTTSGQPDGTEIMVWINHSGFPEPVGSAVTVTIDDATWDVYTSTQTTWNMVSYVRDPGTSYVADLNLKPFFADAISRGSLNPSWYLIAVEMGFEVWTGGQGLAIRNYSVSTSAQ
jgi:Glycosyl hydrolase family 12